MYGYFPASVPYWTCRKEPPSLPEQTEGNGTPTRQYSLPDGAPLIYSRSQDQEKQAFRRAQAPLPIPECYVLSSVPLSLWRSGTSSQDNSPEAGRIPCVRRTRPENASARPFCHGRKIQDDGCVPSLSASRDTQRSRISDPDRRRYSSRTHYGKDKNQNIPPGISPAVFRKSLLPCPCWRDRIPGIWKRDKNFLWDNSSALFPSPVLNCLHDIPMRYHSSSRRSPWRKRPFPLLSSHRSGSRPRPQPADAWLPRSEERRVGNQ